jgi:uncharacterized protein DUF6527
VSDRRLDLGDDHRLRYVGWAPDRDINPQYDGFVDVERFGAIIEHRAPDGSECSGMVTFDLPEVQAVLATESRPRPVWQVQSWDPLTISPSVLCSCGDHGFIREGRWVRA